MRQSMTNSCNVYIIPSCFPCQTHGYLMPPFQSEGPEKKSARPFSSGPVGHVRPFADEGDEREPKRKKSQPLPSTQRKPFGPEGSEESGDEASESESEVCGPGSDAHTTFALGWDTLTNFQKATGWSKHEKEEREKANVKRAHDNSNRLAAAEANPNSRKSGVFASSGADPGRIEALLHQTCKCALINNGCEIQMIQRLVISVLDVSLLGTLCPAGANKKCFRQLQPKEVVAFLKKFWELKKAEQDHLVWNPATVYTLQHLFVVQSLCVYVLGIISVVDGLW